MYNLKTQNKMKTRVTIQVIENCGIKQEQSQLFDHFADAMDALKFYVKKHGAQFNQEKRCWDKSICCGDGIRFIIDGDLSQIFKANEFINS